MSKIIARVGRTYRHKRTQGCYIVLCKGVFEKDLTPVVIYQALPGGDTRIWVRPLSEFEDGRFEDV